MDTTEVRKLVYIEDEVCDMGHIAKDLYVIRVDHAPFMALCPDCLRTILDQGMRLIDKRQKEGDPS